MDDSQHATFVAQTHRLLTEALSRAAGDPTAARQAADEALVLALTRWKHVARTPAPVGWCYLRGLEELRAAGARLPDDDRVLLEADDVSAAARRLDGLTGSFDHAPVDASALVERARRRRSVQALVGMVFALGGVVAVALLLAWMQSPGG